MSDDPYGFAPPDLLDRADQLRQAIKDGVEPDPKLRCEDCGQALYRFRDHDCPAVPDYEDER